MEPWMLPTELDMQAPRERVTVEQPKRVQPLWRRWLMCNWGLCGGYVAWDIQEDAPGWMCARCGKLEIAREREDPGA